MTWRAMSARLYPAACESMFECFSTDFSTRHEVNFGRTVHADPC